jgi:hypothetical protein
VEESFEMKKKPELKVLKILAEIQNPNKRIDSIVWEIFKLSEEKVRSALQVEGLGHQSYKIVEKQVHEYVERIQEDVLRLIKEKYEA